VAAGRTPAINPTVIEKFLAAVARYPDNTLFSYFDGEWKDITYKEFAEAVSATSAYLIRSGIAKGDRVAIISENRPEWCSAYLAIITAGGIAVPIDSQLGPEETGNLLADSGAGAVFYSTKTAPHIETFIPQSVEGGTHPLLINFDTPGYAAASSSPAETAAGSESGISGDDIASIIYTSGTTGVPKGVQLSHTNFCSDADSLIEAGIVSHDDNVLSLLPLHHTYAFMCTFLTPLFIGATITYPASLKGPDITAAMREKGVSVLVGVPQLLDMIRNGILNKIKALPAPAAVVLLRLHRLSGLLRKKLGLNIGRIISSSAHKALGRRFRFFASGGAKLAPEIMNDLEAFGFTVLEGYGLTETSPVITFNPIEDRRAGSAGKPLPSAEIRLLDPDATGDGEILVRGPMVMRGYYKAPEATANVINRDGWLMTGDIGRLDKDGYLYITGRSKEVIVLSSGKNIYPEEVEKLYSASPLIKEICAIGRENNDGSETLHAVIVPDLEYAKKTGVANLQETIKWEINAVSGRVPAYMRITGFSLSSEPLPRTPLGKIRRFLVRDNLRLREKGAPKKPEQREEVYSDETMRLVAGALRRFLREDGTVGIDDNLELDLGLDSLSKIELTAALEKEFSVSLPEDFMSDIHTVGELAEKIRNASSAGANTGLPAESGWKGILKKAPAEEDLKMLSLEPPENRMAGAFIVHSILRTMFKIFFRLEAVGMENIPAGRNYIIAPNHTSYLDGFVLILSLPFRYFRNIYVLGLREFFLGFVRSRLARTAHVIPIDSASYLSKALQISAHVLNSGRSLCVFPEGGRSPDGGLLEFKKGVGILACEMDVPVVPACISGAFESMPRGRFFPRPVKITVTFGRPLLAADMDFSKIAEGTDKYQYFADRLRGRVEELKKPADTGGKRSPRV